jgi:hypothetical protein
MNGSMPDEHPTGVGIYSINLINSLSKLYISDKFSELKVFTMNRLVNEKELYEDLRRKSLLQSKKISWPCPAQRLKDLIENINHN